MPRLHPKFSWVKFQFFFTKNKKRFFVVLGTLTVFFVGLWMVLTAINKASWGENFLTAAVVVTAFVALWILFRLGFAHTTIERFRRKPHKNVLDNPGPWWPSLLCLSTGLLLVVVGVIVFFVS